MVRKMAKTSLSPFFKHWSPGGSFMVRKIAKTSLSPVFNPQSPGGTFMVRKMVITSTISVFYGLKRTLTLPCDFLP